MSIIGDHVMIAPNFVIIAFNHGFANVDISMVNQANTESLVYIENDVRIGSNVTITKRGRIGIGAIIGANSLVNRDIISFSIVVGVPAKIIKYRS